MLYSTFFLKIGHLRRSSRQRGDLLRGIRFIVGVKDIDYIIYYGTDRTNEDLEQ
jgi:hypothetical protein